MISILGISAFYHDSAACVLKDGEIIQKGNHNKLKKEKGYYKEIYSEQMEAKKLNNFDN